VLDVKDVPSCAAPCSSVKLVKLRNPWGTGEWHGAFSDTSCYWSDEAREACKLEAAEDGIFWMTLADFRRYFAAIAIAPFELSLAADTPVVLAAPVGADAVVVDTMERDEPAAEPAAVAEPTMEPIVEPTLCSLFYGREVRLRHVATGRWLHSHETKYPEGSKQQQVTCYGGRDDNDMWRVKAAHEAEAREGAVSDGDEVRLEHVATGRNLHSHPIKSAVSAQYEVSCFGEDGVGDANDNWRLVLEEGKAGFRLQHIETAQGGDGHFLHSHSLQYPDWGFEQQEVTNFDGKDDNDLWVVETE